MKAYDLCGVVGVTLIVWAYLTLQIGWLRVVDLKYSVANAIGAALVLVSLCFRFNLSAFLVELFWAVISVLGCWKSWRTLRRGVSTRGAGSMIDGS